MIVPSQESSDVFIGDKLVTLSNVTLGSILQHANVEIFTVEEPQIAGVSDEDIKDASAPVTYEDVEAAEATNSYTHQE